VTLERVADLEKVPVRGTLQVFTAGEPICLVRVDEHTVKAVHDTCSHQQFSLAEGWVEDGTIECNLHGSAFDLDSGAPTSLPAFKPIPVYACQVRDGGVFVDATRALNGAPAPRH
jgi:3-phenylpropionate/trans-cinnamate dioxygenase ferredoxin subunit